MNTNEKVVLPPEVQKRIEGLLREKGISEHTLSVSRGAVKGDNYLGLIAKVRIEGIDEKGNKVTFDWIVKSAPHLEVFRKMLNVEKIYEREVYMYDKLLPLFKEFQEERNVIEPFKSTAPLIMYCMEPHNESLAMQDMKAIGYVMEDRFKPLDYSHVRLVLKTYGKLHALSYALKDQRPEVFRQITKDIEKEVFDVSDREMMGTVNDFHNQRAMKSLDPAKDAHIVKIFEKYAENTFDVLTSTTKSNEYSVITHGDSWINNMLFKYGSTERSEIPTKLCLLDWQLSRHGSPVLDLSYFIFTCTDKALRDKHFDSMIRLYYYSLCKHLNDLGSDPEKMLPFKVLEDELKRNAVFGMYTSIIALFIMMSTTDEIPDFEGKSDAEMAEIFFYKSKNEEVYHRRVRENIIEFVERGFFNF